MIGKLISHYRVIEQVGQGGMGEVYLADDLKLERQVALKFLPQHLTKDKENVERFEREAKAAAALNHPNIITIYEIAKEDDPHGGGQTFIVMEYVGGESLRTKLDQGKLDHDEIIDITKQICKGLEKAHQADIVHRDIKPENILINTDGRVKILDFGLAKLKGVSKLTKETSTLGTIHYMSPEQIQGKEVDHRSDIWSLGVVLYEMLTGEPPFKGEYEQSVQYAILNEEPKLTENIPVELQQILKIVLNKNPDQRFQNCKDILGEIDNLKTTKTRKRKPITQRSYIFSTIVAILTLILFYILFVLPIQKDDKSIKSLAVLPFINLKPDSNTDYLGLAFTAEIINDMSYFKNITTLPFSSVREISNKEQLNVNVDYILTASFIKLKDKINLNMECFESKTEKILWQESLDRPFDESHILLGDVSKKVINGLKIRFSNIEQKRMEKDIPNDPLAYEYYSKALSYDYTLEGSSIAIEMLNKSIQIDSTYAPAFYELGYHTLRISTLLLGHSDEYLKAEEYLLKAISLNSDYIEAHTLLSGIYTETGNTDKAFIITKEALRINPNNAWTHFRLSYIYRYVGMNNESVLSAGKALELLPDNPRFRSVIRNYIYARNFKKALEVVNLDQSSPLSVLTTARMFLRMRDTLKAVTKLKQSIEMEPDSHSYVFNQANAYLASLKKEFKTAKRYVQRNEIGIPYDGEILFDIAVLYGFMGDNENCIRVLKKTVKGGFFNYPFFLVDPFLDPVRDDPEFQEVLALAKQKHETFKQKYFADEE